MNKLFGRRFYAWAGIIYPVLFVAIFSVEGWLRPGYDPGSMHISALSLGPRGWIQITNFIVSGLLLLLFTCAVSNEFSNGKSPKRGMVLMIVIGFCYLLSGPFVMDPAGIPQNQASMHGTIHGLLGGFVFLLMPICILSFPGTFRKETNWRSLWYWTLILGIFDAAAVLFFTLASKLPALQIQFNEWIGLIQRTALIPFMIWIFIFALGILRRTKKE